MAVCVLYAIYIAAGIAVIHHWGGQGEQPTPDPVNSPTTLLSTT